jgi:hypothetical protein
MDWWPGISLDDANSNTNEKQAQRSNNTNANSDKPSSFPGRRVFTLVDLLDSLVFPKLLASPCITGPFSATIVQHRRKIGEHGLILYARVTSGRIAVGDIVTVTDEMRQAIITEPFKIRGDTIEERARQRELLKEKIALGKRRDTRNGIDTIGGEVFVARVLSIRMCNKECEAAQAGTGLYGLRVELVNKKSLVPDSDADSVPEKAESSTIDPTTTDSSTFHCYSIPTETLVKERELTVADFRPLQHSQELTVADFSPLQHSEPKPVSPKMEERIFARGRLLVGLGTPLLPAPRARFFTAHCAMHYVEQQV